MTRMFIKMSDLQNYIYLLQEREFIKTKENIYKIGMTKKENFTRFNQYPKGSVLLFQMICNNCQEMEKQVLKLFREKFVQKLEIGNEYFQGNYTDMIDVIYFVIRHENTCKPPEIVDVSETKPIKKRTTKPRKTVEKTVPIETQQQTETVEEKTQMKQDLHSSLVSVNEATETLTNNTTQKPVAISYLPAGMDYLQNLSEYRNLQDEKQQKEFMAMRKVFEINRILFPNGVK